MVPGRAKGLLRSVAVLLPLAAMASGWGCSARGRTAELYPQLMEHAGREVLDVGFIGGEPFRHDTLQAVIETRPTRCFLLGLPICFPFTDWGRQQHDLSPDRVGQDVNRLILFFRREGYFGTTVRPDVDDLDDGVRVVFHITRGNPVFVESVRISGTEGILDPDTLARRLPLQPGQIFHLGQFAASADTVLWALQARGHAHAELLRNFTVEAARNAAVVELEAIPGPQVRVDSIILAGAEHLGPTTALRQLTFRRGDLLLLAQLIESQRNLYSLPIVQFASVSVAPDTLQVAPADEEFATVLVQVSEADVHQVDGALGWGNVECFRAEAQWESRSFGGGARRLLLASAASKLGIGAGLGETLCRAFEADTLAARLDYRLSAELTQPYFLSARNNVTVNVFAERYSEPAVFQRDAVGGRIGLTRRVGPRMFVSGSLDAERGSTVSTDAVFCAAFEICDPETIGLLARPRLRNTLSVSGLRDRTDAPLEPTRGYLARTGVTWAPSWLLSDVTFVRWTGELSSYWQVRPRWVAAGSVRFGTVFQTASPGRVEDFLPPEERFFAGGATTVRGYLRNRLGPGVYVAAVERDPETDEPVRDPDTGELIPIEQTARFFPSGGTSLLVLNGELRTPSPWLSHLLRLAFFVDAGSVGSGQLWDPGTRLQFTPGAGLRLQTPVGPVRMDLAYNPYGPTSGPLYVADPDTGVLRRVREAFRAEPGGFLDRLRLQLAVGQAF